MYKKSLQLALLLLLLTFSFCQSTSQKTKENETKKAHEFDQSSKIETIEITQQNIENLALLCKIWGFLKYYHPAVAKGDYNWDFELFRFLPDFLKVDNSIERDKKLIEWIKKMGEIGITRNTMEEPNVKMKPDLDWITNSRLNPQLVIQLTDIKNIKKEYIHHYIDLAGGAGNPIFKNEEQYAAMKYPDAGYRLLALFRYWNIIQYYFPYKYLIEEDWKEVLKEFIPKFVNAKNELEYKIAVLKIIARLHDTHANIWGNDSTLYEFRGKNCVPVKVSYIENKAIVSGYYDQILGKESGLLTGDEIIKINNQTIEDIIREKLEFTPASNFPTQMRSIAPNLLRTNDSKLIVQYIRNGISNILELKTYPLKNFDFNKIFLNSDSCFKLINQKTAYLYLGTIKSRYLRKIMGKVKDTKGLIIDLRCYPSEFVVFSLGEYLMPKPAAFVKFSNGSIFNPGYFTITHDFEIGKVNKDYYKGKLVILVNENTQSQAEYTTMAFRVAPNAKVIGSTTAGADGNVSHFYLPGGIRTTISGIGVYYPDGRETQRIGIVPDIEVKPTIEGIKAGKDEVLEYAVDFLNKKK